MHCGTTLEQMYVRGCRLGCEEPWDENFGATIKLPRCSGVNANKAIHMKGRSTLISSTNRIERYNYSIQSIISASEPPFHSPCPSPVVLPIF